MDKKTLTSENGRPIADNQNVQTAGLRGPMTVQDPWYIEKISHFDREVIPERRMHAKGSGAFGTFTVTNDLKESHAPQFFPRSASRLHASSVSLPLQANVEQPTRSATSAGLQ